MRQRTKDFQEIADFLKDLRFKKSFIGANEADVYACLKDVDAMYKDKLVEMVQKYESEIARLNAQPKPVGVQSPAPQSFSANAAEMEKAQTLIVQLREQLQKEENGRRQAEYQLEQLRQMPFSDNRATVGAEDDYRKKCELLTQTMLDIQNDKTLIAQKAQQDADKLLEHARAEAYYLQMEQRGELKKEKDEVVSELKQLRELKAHYSYELQQIYDTISSVLDKVAGCEKQAKTIDLLSRMRIG